LADVDFQLLFGAGRNTQARTEDVADTECADGENFDVTLSDAGFQPRLAFDKVATATNTGSIRGYAQLTKQDGTLSTLIQAGSTVYEWDGTSGGFTSVGSCNANSRLRGPESANFTLSDVVIITDLQKQTVVKTWDGTNFSTMTTGLGADFFAKYCLVQNERAIFGNVKSGTDTPHLIAASEVEDNTNLSLSSKPASGATAADPWYLPVQDLKPINGLFDAFGVLGISTEKGRLWKLSGQDKTDFAIQSLYRGSAAAGDEAVSNAGNDVIYGRVGVIESLAATESFGDVQTDDLSRWIKPEVEDITDWTVVYDQRLQKIYCFPDGVGEVHVLNKNLLGSGLSPWTKYTTNDPLDFQPVTAWCMKHPTSGIDFVYMGDSTGNIYQMEGSGGQDGGTANISAWRRSRLFKSSLDGVSNVTGFVDYLKNTAAHDLILTFEHQGTNILDQSVTVSIPALTTGAVYGGSYHYNLGS